MIHKTFKKYDIATRPAEYKLKNIIEDLRSEEHYIIVKVLWDIKAALGLKDKEILDSYKEISSLQQEVSKLKDKLKKYGW